MFKIQRGKLTKSKKKFYCLRLVDAKHDTDGSPIEG